MSLPARTTILIVCMFTCALPIPGPGQSKPEPTVATLRQKVLDATNREEVNAAEHRLISECGTSHLALATQNPSW